MKKNFILLGITIAILIIAGVFIYLNYLNKKDVNVLQEIKKEDINLVESQTREIQSSTLDSIKSFTMTEVEKRNSKESCWSVIRGKVYDLTNWIDKHPGGLDKILNICGKDGTEIFEKVHGGKEKPENILKNFEIGVLKE